nr:endonuclease domain-containing protein [Aureimonas sp. Leaf460]
MSHDTVPLGRRAQARRMRMVMTDAESRFWSAVRAHRLEGIGFRRPFPIAGFIVDFACPSHRLVVEIDGSQHGRHREIIRDVERTKDLERSGWLVLRFWNDDVLKDVEGVCAHVLAVVCELERGG